MGHGTGLNVEVGGCCAGRWHCGATATMLDHVGVLGGEWLGGDCHVIALGDYGHVVRVGRVTVGVWMGD